MTRRTLNPQEMLKTQHRDDDDDDDLPDEVSRVSGGPVSVRPDFSLENASTNISKIKHKH